MQMYADTREPVPQCELVRCCLNTLSVLLSRWVKTCQCSAAHQGVSSLCCPACTVEIEQGSRACLQSKSWKRVGCGGQFATVTQAQRCWRQHPLSKSELTRVSIHLHWYKWDNEIRKYPRNWHCSLYNKTNSRWIIIILYPRTVWVPGNQYHSWDGHSVVLHHIRDVFTVSSVPMFLESNVISRYKVKGYPGTQLQSQQ